eukprot:3371185-Amphidinium_carterae.1
MPIAALPPKGNSKGKSGKQKSKLDTSRWAAHDSAGVEICRNFHFGVCKLTPDACRRSHTCPVTKEDGTTCGGAHRAGSCPYLSSA